MSATLLPPPTADELAIMQHLRENLKGKLAVDDVTFDPRDNHTLLRFSRNAAGDKEKALAALEGCIEWRNQTKPYKITFDQVAHVASHRLNIMCGRSKQKIPILNAQPRVGTKIPPEDRLKYNLFLQEELMRRGYKEMLRIMDFSQAGRPDELDSKAREMNQEHENLYYPLFASRSFMTNLSMGMSLMMSVAMAFQSTAIKSTMIVGAKPKDLLELVDAEELLQTVGGQKVIDEHCDIFSLLPPPCA